MGDVYLGEDTRLNRKVALKCLHPSPQEDSQRVRIIHEARAAAQINHGNVATIHDVIDEGPRAYIVMEYVDGESLAARVRRGRLPLAEVLSIGRQLLSALGAAHAVGVVHRDLKPANIQLTRGGVVKVLDFGIARARQTILASSADPTQSALDTTGVPEARAGSPAYMAPEQTLGVAADQRADLYSLGVVLFELATGRRPYDSIDPLELVRMPDSFAPRATDLDPTVPARLADVLAKALKSDPGLRYQSAAEFDDGIATVQSELNLSRRPSRRQWLVSAGAAVAGVTGVLLWREFRGGPPVGLKTIRSLAVLPFVNLSGDPGQEYFVDGMTDGLINALGRISAVSVTARTSVMALKGSKKSVAEIARDLNVDAVVEGSALLVSEAAEVVRVTINVIDPATQTQLWSTALERDVTSVLTIPAELARAIAERINVAVRDEEQARFTAAAQTVEPEAFKMYLLGRQAWAGRTVPDLQRALVYFAEAAKRSPDYAQAYAGLADTYVLLTGDFAAFPRADGAAQTIAHASRALALDPGLAEAYTSLAFANFFLQWDFAAAAQQFQKALALNPSYSTAHHWYGNYLSDIGREEEASREMRRAPRSIRCRRSSAATWRGRSFSPVATTKRSHSSTRRCRPSPPIYPPSGCAPGHWRCVASTSKPFISSRRRSGAPTVRGRGASWRGRTRCAGRRADALAELRSAQALKTGLYSYDVALVYAALNDTRQALAALEQAFQEHDSTLVNLRHDPRFDSLRNEARYQKLVSQMRFPQL